MWQEKLQDAVASYPWLEPHQDIKRTPQAPGMQLVDWYGFSSPAVKISSLSARSTTSTLFSTIT